MVAQGMALPRPCTTASLPTRRVQLQCAVASMEAWGAQLWGDGLPAELSGTEWEAPRSVLAGVFLAQVGGILQVYAIRYTGCESVRTFMSLSRCVNCFTVLLSHSTILELMQTLLLHVETVQYSFLSRWGQCMILVLALLPDILNAFIPLASGLINISENSRKLLSSLKLQGE